MQTDIVNISLGFLEGLALIVSPCILPILPILLAGSVTGSKRRPFGIIVGFVLTFALFTFFSRKLVQITGIDLNLVRNASYALLILLGFIMLSTYLTEKFTYFTQKLVNAGSQLKSANNTQGGFFSGLAFGGIIAIIWTPCAGPILAAVIVQTVVQQSSLVTFLILLAFGLGAAVPMLIIAVFGRQILAKFTFIKTHTVLFRKLLGIIIIVSVAYMIFLENQTNTPTTIVPVTLTNNTPSYSLEDGLSDPYPAPALSGISTWINSSPITLEQLKGKVVLIDFWTYSCINCVRTLPFLNALYAKYHDQGFVIIGIHTPEFEFEKNIENIKNAVKRYGIHYPVAVDSQFVTWQNFNNRYWPAHYLINKNGEVVYTHFGEGNDDVTENNVRYLLGVTTPKKVVTDIQQNHNERQTPETYLGYARAANFAGLEPLHHDAASSYTQPPLLEQDQWALKGDWLVTSDKITATQTNASIELKFHAKHVYVVMGNGSNQPIDVNITLNGQPVQSEQGKDVKNSSIHVDHDTIYEVLSLTKSDTGIVTITAEKPGLEIYTFTFGN